MSDSVGYLQALRERFEPPAITCNDSIELLSSEDVLVDGVQVKQTKYVVDDSAHRFDGVKASDFALQNLQSAGVDLRQCFCRSSNFAAVEHLEIQAIKMSEFNYRIPKE